jgi:apolipoprotein N-acyltransferase
VEEASQSAEHRKTPDAVRHIEDRARPLAAVAVTLMLYAIAGADLALWPAAILAPLPLLAVVPELPDRLGAQAAAVAYLLGNVVLWPAEILAAPILLVVMLHALGAVAFAAIAVLHAEAARRWHGWLAALVYPALTTALWFGVSVMSPHGLWGDPAFGMTSLLPLMQIAAFTGLAGVTFVMAMAPAVLAVAWYRRRWGMQWRRTAWMFAVPVAAFALGGVRMLFPAAGGSVRVGLAASDRLMEATRATKLPEAAKVVALYAPLVRKLAKRGAQAVVLPEKIVGVSGDYEPRIVARFADLARSNHVWLVTGLNEIGRNPSRNVAIVFSSDGVVVSHYAKQYLVTGLEAGYAPGSSLAIFDAPWGRTAVAICKDLDFPALDREIARSGAKFVFAPAWDWPGSEQIHERMALAMAVASGFSVARAAREGIVSAIDSHGVTIGAVSTFTADPALLSAALPAGAGATFYARSGDWFGALIVVLAGVLIALLALSMRSTRMGTAASARIDPRPGGEPVFVEVPPPDQGTEGQ